MIGNKPSSNRPLNLLKISIDFLMYGLSVHLAQYGHDGNCQETNPGLMYGKYKQYTTII